MEEILKFLKVNNLKKSELADYLGVSNAFVTQLCSGERALPVEKLALIKADESLDSSMLCSRPISAVATNGGLAVAGTSIHDNEFKAEPNEAHVDALKEKVAILERENERLMTVINKQFAMIDKLIGK